MAKEILAIPEDYLREVIIVIRSGLSVAPVRQEVIDVLDKWCDDEERYLDG